MTEAYGAEDLGFEVGVRRRKRLQRGVGVMVPAVWAKVAWRVAAVRREGEGG